jgi:succinate dehydrogenase / fumarate reductase cytochrome b subunit
VATTPSSTPAPSANPAAKPKGAPGFLDRHHFLLRRLHSLTGLVPIGVFLIAHLTTNSSIAWGKFGLRGKGGEYAFGSDGVSIVEGGVAYFVKEVQWINDQIPHLLLIEIVLWVSIAFHAGLGIVYARTGRTNTLRYAYADNWRYRLQRISGYIALFYIFYHVATLRWGWTFLVPGGTKWSADYSASTMAAALQGSATGWTWLGLIVSLFYFVGVSSSVFHFANGLWTSAITWGLTVSARAQRRWGVVCAGLGVALMGAAWSSLLGFMVLNQDEARQVERDMLNKGAPAAEVYPADPDVPTGPVSLGN